MTTWFRAGDSRRAEARRKLPDLRTRVAEAVRREGVAVSLAIALAFFVVAGGLMLMREEVLPSIRRQHRQFRIWHAGCSSGEEVLAMCILLKEIGMLDDVSITATDLDEAMLEVAQSHRYPMKNMELNARNYSQAGGTEQLGQYFRQHNGEAVFDASLLAGVEYKRHDLVVDNIFDTFHLVLCRNVMIYFNESLQNSVLKKFYQSLLLNGFLSIGSKESLLWCEDAKFFAAVNSNEKIYQKIRV